MQHGLYDGLYDADDCGQFTSALIVSMTSIAERNTYPNNYFHLLSEMSKQEKNKGKQSLLG